MREDALNRIGKDTAGLPERWREVLMQCLSEANFESEAELLIKSALAVHANYPPNMEPAEAILAGDAFIPMSLESLLESNSLAEIDLFLSRAVGKFDK
ncbi:MAG: hypothetical protein GY852_10560 [bacterium]|nr:hypothetical protein [bacterium]